MSREMTTWKFHFGFSGDFIFCNDHILKAYPIAHPKGIRFREKKSKNLKYGQNFKKKIDFLQN